MKAREFITEAWSQKYKSSINCSHPRGFSQRAHCAGKKKHNESVEMEMVCEDCGMCQTHGSLNEIRKGEKDSNGYTRCWPGKHAEGTKTGKNGGQVRNCVPNESIEESEGKRCRQCGMINCKCPGDSCKCKPIAGWIPGKGFKKAIDEAANAAQQAAIAIAKKQDVAEEENNHWYDAGVRDATHGARPNPRTYLPTLKDKRAKHPEEVYFYMNGYKSVKQGVAEGHQDDSKEREENLRYSRSRNPVADAIRKKLNPNQKEQNKEKGVAEAICSLEEAHAIFDDFEQAMAARGLNEDVFDTISDEDIIRETAAWRRSAGKSKKGGLNAKGVASYRREHPGSKLQMAVTTKPSKLKPGSKAAKRRKSFCARMSGVKGPMKKPNGKPTRKALALRKWNC